MTIINHVDAGASTFEAYPHRSKNDGDSTLGDLLADLMYFARENDIDFEDALTRARGYFQKGL